MSSIFTQIVAGEMPGHIVWQDELCFSILTIQPIRNGHALVIPREEVDHWVDVPAATAAHLFQVAQKIAKAQQKVFPCRKVGMMIAGLEVPHTHIHLLPIDSLAEFNFSLSHEADPGTLADAADRLRAALVKAGHSQAKPQAQASSSKLQSKVQ